MGSLIRIIAFFAISGSAHAQPETAYTSPLGLYVAKISGASSDGTPARTYLGAQLLTDMKFYGRVDNVNGSVFSIQGVSELAQLFFLGAEFGPEREFYVHVHTGIGEGFIADVVEFRESDILCNGDLTAWMSHDVEFSIRFHPNLLDLFGATNQFGLGSGIDADSSDNIVVWDAQIQQERVYYFHATRNRWEEKEVDADAGATPVRFPNGLYIVRRSASPLRISLFGEVGFRSVLLPVRTGANVFTLPINLSSSIESLITSDGPFSIISGSNSNNSDLLTLEEAATGLQRGPFYFSSGLGPMGWREVGISDSNAAIQPLELLSTLILRRQGPAGFVLAKGSLEPPASGILVPIAADPEPGEAPLSAEIVLPSLFRFHSSIEVYLESSYDLITWNRIQYLLPGTPKVTLQVPAGESRAFYRFAASPRQF